LLEQRLRAGVIAKLDARAPEVVQDRRESVMVGPVDLALDREGFLE
jgi:hypothetical protein